MDTTQVVADLFKRLPKDASGRAFMTLEEFVELVNNAIGHCETCNWWRAEQDTVDNAVSYRGQVLIHATVLATKRECSWLWVFTEPDFGCIKWEAK